jgi:hypothetical protein
MDEFYLKAKMVNGNLIINNHDQVRSTLSQLDGKDLIVHVQIFNNKASNKQIRWYWGVAIQKIIQEHKKKTGEFISKEEVHAFNIQEIVKPRLTHREIMGKTVIEIDNFSLSGMSKTEFSNFKNRLQEYWAKRDVDIPDPGENDFTNDATYERLKGIDQTGT